MYIDSSMLHAGNSAQYMHDGVYTAREIKLFSYIFRFIFSEGDMFICLLGKIRQVFPVA